MFAFAQIVWLVKFSMQREDELFKVRLFSYFVCTVLYLRMTATDAESGGIQRSLRVHAELQHVE